MKAMIYRDFGPAEVLHYESKINFDPIFSNRAPS